MSKSSSKQHYFSLLKDEATNLTLFLVLNFLSVPPILFSRIRLWRLEVGLPNPRMQNLHRWNFLKCFTFSVTYLLWEVSYFFLNTHFIWENTHVQKGRNFFSVVNNLAYKVRFCLHGWMTSTCPCPNITSGSHSYTLLLLLIIDVSNQITRFQSSQKLALFNKILCF